MKPPMYVGPLSSKQRQRLESGLRFRDGFELRRCQMRLVSARGERPSPRPKYATPAAGRGRLR